METWPIWEATDVVTGGRGKCARLCLLETIFDLCRNISHDQNNNLLEKWGEGRDFSNNF